MSLGIENVTSVEADNLGSPYQKTITVSTSGTDRICVLMIYAENNTATPPTVATPPTSAHVTWTKAFSATPAQSGPYGGGDPVDMEVWVGEASSQLSSEVVTVTWSGAVDGGGIIFMAVSGASSAVPFMDPNSANPQSGNTTSLTLSTTNNDSVLVQWSIIGAASGGAGGLASGFTSQWTLNDHNPTDWDIQGVMGTNIVTSPVTNDALALSGLGSNPAYVAFAITGDEAAAPSGTWVSTESTDAMSCTGGLLGGAWNSTETKDVLTASGHPAPNGSWASVEVKDFFAAPGYPQLNGSWDSIETKDIFAMSVHGAGGDPLGGSPPLGSGRSAGHRRISIVT